MTTHTHTHTSYTLLCKIYIKRNVKNFWPRNQFIEQKLVIEFVDIPVRFFIDASIEAFIKEKLIDQNNLCRRKMFYRIAFRFLGSTNIIFDLMLRRFAFELVNSFMSCFSSITIFLYFE